MLFSKFDKVLVFFLITVFAVIVVFAAANVDSAKPYHPIQQVSVSSSSNVSVDQDGNGNVDWADNAVKALYATTSGTATTATTATSSTTSTSSTTATTATNADKVKCPDGTYKAVGSCGFEEALSTRAVSCVFTSTGGLTSACAATCNSDEKLVGGGYDFAGIYAYSLLGGFAAMPYGENSWYCAVNLAGPSGLAGCTRGNISNGCESYCYAICAKVS